MEESGKMYGYWRVISFSHVDKHYDANFLCECTLCGAIKPVRGFALRNGRTKKCKHCSNTRRWR